MYFKKIADIAENNKVKLQQPLIWLISLNSENLAKKPG